MSNAKAAGVLGLSAGATDAMIVEAIRNLQARERQWREMAQREPWAERLTRWEVIPERAMIAHEGQAWHVTRRQVQERRRVKVWLRGVGREAERIYGFDDVANVLVPTGEHAVHRLLRAELGAQMMTPEAWAEVTPLDTSALQEGAA
jgi:hypothetical protein